jgi:hypothetical protein
MSEIKKLSSSIASSIDVEAVGFDPITILSLVTGIITAIMNCSKTENVSEADAKEEFQSRYESNPRQVENRVKHQVRVQSRKDGKVLKGKALEEVTQKTIAGLLGADDAVVTACCSEVK